MVDCKLVGSVKQEDSCVIIFSKRGCLSLSKGETCVCYTVIQTWDTQGICCSQYFNVNNLCQDKIFIEECIIFKESALRPIISQSCDVSLYIYMSVPSPSNFFEASHWPSDHMIRSRLLIGPNLDHTVPAPCDGPPQVAWRALEILFVFTTASKREGTYPMKVKQSLACYV